MALGNMHEFGTQNVSTSSRLLHARSLYDAVMRWQPLESDFKVEVFVAHRPRDCRGRSKG
jgi:hypothetical protein